MLRKSIPFPLSNFSLLLVIPSTKSSSLLLSFHLLVIFFNINISHTINLPKFLKLEEFWLHRKNSFTIHMLPAIIYYCYSMLTTPFAQSKQLQWEENAMCGPLLLLCLPLETPRSSHMTFTSPSLLKMLHILTCGLRCNTCTLKFLEWLFHLCFSVFLKEHFMQWTVLTPLFFLEEESHKKRRRKKKNSSTASARSILCCLSMNATTWSK